MHGINFYYITIRIECHSWVPVFVCICVWLCNEQNIKQKFQMYIMHNVRHVCWRLGTFAVVLSTIISFETLNHPECIVTVTTSKAHKFWIENAIITMHKPYHLYNSSFNRLFHNRSLFLFKRKIKIRKIQ